MRVIILAFVLALATQSIADWPTQEPPDWGANWGISVHTDPMTDNTVAYATGGWVEPQGRISGVYSNLRAVMGFGCDGGDEWAYVKFNQPFNAADSRTRNGFNLIQAAVRWDKEKPIDVQGGQRPGGDSVHFGEDFIEEMQTHSRALIGVSLQSAGEVYFRFELGGAVSVISEARDSCLGN